jgi:acyl-CoA hydrolase
MLVANAPATLDVDELPELLTPGTRVFIPGTSGEPTAFLEALRRNPASAAGVHFIANFVPGINEFDLLGLDPGCRYTCFFVQAALEKHVASARLSFMPVTYYGIDRYLRSEAGPDLAVVQVSPPDASGTCSLGICVEFNPTVLSVARRRVAIVNERMPRLPGSVDVNLSEFDMVSFVDRALAGPQADSGDSVAISIAGHVASLVEDGDTIQLGIGKIPARVIKALRGHRRLRVHSGIVGEEIGDLIRCGAMEGDHPVVCGAFAASDEFLRREPRMPWLTVRPIAFTHHPATLATIERLVAINSALEVDLLGQVNAEVAGGRRISGPGGMPDFGPAAHSAAAGRSIIALPATASHGRQSRVVSRLSSGSPVTLARTAVDYVVTEFGIAELRGRSEPERVRALIEVAHPAFRAKLIEDFYSTDS